MLQCVPVAQGTERLPSKQRVAGSNPAWDAKCAPFEHDFGPFDQRKQSKWPVFIIPNDRSDTLPVFTTRQLLPASLACQTLFPREASAYHDKQKYLVENHHGAKGPFGNRSQGGCSFP